MIFFPSSFSKNRYGYHCRVISRPELYNILVRAIPSSKVLLGKQVHTLEQEGSTTTCVCTDGSSYSGIIVGADGAYSSVRLNMYRQLKDRNLLPTQDRKPMQYQYQALVGMTRPFLDSEPSTAHSKTSVVVSQGENPFTVTVSCLLQQMPWSYGTRFIKPPLTTYRALLFWL